MKNKITDLAVELMENVYDTLMENVGENPIYKKFPLERVSNQFVNGGKMYFEYDGKAFEISIKETDILTD